MKKIYKAVFLDRDGTIFREWGYLGDSSKLHLYPFVPKALKILKRSGYKIVVVTNQSGVGRGYFSLATLNQIHDKFKLILKRHGTYVDGIYFCPHAPHHPCTCRKPKIGLLSRARRDLSLDLRRSYVVGDHINDLYMAKRAGVKAILVLTGKGRTYRRKAMAMGAKVSFSLLTGARWISKQSKL